MSNYHLSAGERADIKLWSDEEEDGVIRQAIWLESLGITIEQSIRFDPSGECSWH